MKPLLLSLLLSLTLNATVPAQMLQLYQQAQYGQSCELGRKNLKKIQFNEAHLSLYAFACLKADRIDRLSDSLEFLNKSTEARTNASYFSMLILQKKLLIQALYDNYHIKALQFPNSSHLLSKVFHFYVNNPQNETSIKEYNDVKNPRISYKLYPMQLNDIKSIAIDEYYDKILTQHHLY